MMADDRAARAAHRAYGLRLSELARYRRTLGVRGQAADPLADLAVRVLIDECNALDGSDDARRAMLRGERPIPIDPADMRRTFAAIRAAFGSADAGSDGAR